VIPPIRTKTVIELPGHWLVTAIAASLLVVLALMTRAQLELDPHNLVDRLFALIAVAGIVARVALRRPRTRTHRIARDAIDHLGLFALICLVGALASYPVAANTQGFEDFALERTDRLLRFNWISWYDFVAAHPWLQIAESVLAGRSGVGASGRDNGAAFRPGTQISWCCLAPIGRIRQGKDHRPVCVLCHVAHNVFGDGACLPGRSDKRCRMSVYDNVGEADAVRLCAFPAGYAVAALRERQLKRLQATHAVNEQALSVDEVKPAARFRFTQAGLDHGK